MLIGIDASRANRPVKTGVEWYSHHLIEQFKKIDSDNRYFLYTQKHLEGDLAVLPLNFKQKILKWLPIRFWTLIRLSFEMKYGKEVPELLFVPAHTIPLFNPGKVVVTVHDIGFERHPEFYHWADKLYHRWTIKFIKKNATKIITVSEFSKKEIIEIYGIPEDRIIVTPISYDKETYKVLDIEKSVLDKKILDKYKIKDPYFMFVGRLEKKKNIDGLINAFLQYKEAHPDDKHKLVLVGTRGLTFNEMEATLEMQNKTKDIIYLEYVKDSNDVAMLINGADLYIFPSRYEGFGIPALEAMACGCPLICSNTASLPEVVGQAAIMFNPENTDAIVKAIETVVQNPEVREALVQAGLERVKEFSWERCARQTLEIFKQL